MDLHAQIMADLAFLESLKRRKGLVTRRMLQDALPAGMLDGYSPAILTGIADQLNAALADAAETEPGTSSLRVDHQARAAGGA